MTISTRVLITVNGKSAWATNEQAQSIATLEATRKGGFASVTGYVANNGEQSNIVFTSRFNVSKLNDKKSKALKSMTVQDIATAVKGNTKLSALSDKELALAFESRKTSELASIQATSNGNRSDAHRQAHDRCYIAISDGVLVHLVTEADANGIKQPVITNGFPVVDSVMLNCLQVSKQVIVKGEYKTVNSGVPVLISNAMKAVLKAQGIRSIKRLSFKNNFTTMLIDTNTFEPDDLKALA